MKLIVVGVAGKMGQLIIQQALTFKEFEIVGAVGTKGRFYINQDIGLVAQAKQLLNINVSDNLEDIIEKCDIVIDFSNIENSFNVLELCVKYNKKLVNGITGYTKEQMKEFEIASKKIPFIYAANTSKSMHLIHEVIKFLTMHLKDSTDIEIIEMHSNDKVDAPSGTSLEIGHLIAETMGNDFDEIAKFGRKEKREKNEITYHSLRIGNMPSSHIVIFGNENDRIEIAQHSYNFKVFARGACECALYLKDKDAGWYDIKDALDVKF